MLAIERDATAVAPPMACSDAPYRVDVRYARAAGWAMDTIFPRYANP